MDSLELTPVGDAWRNRSRSLGLDLLRALAILLVLISHWANNILYWFHATPYWKVFYLGSLGVELFFALSGFLIGTILIEAAQGGFEARDMGVFLVRRWMRTLPLYAVCLAVLALAFPPAAHRLRDLIEFATMTQNLTRPMPQDGWFAVSWSLAIEEWFYVLFAVATFAAFKLSRSRSAIWGPIGIFVLVPVGLRLATPHFGDPSRPDMAKIVFLRLDEIAYGVAMAQLYAQRSRIFRFPKACLTIGLALILSAWLVFNGYPARLPQALVFNVAILGCVLLIPAALTLERAPRWFGAIVGTGSALSYGVYLTHEAILVDVVQNLLWARHGAPTWACVVIAVVAPVVLAYVSYRFLERPLLKRRPSQVRESTSQSIGADAAGVAA